MSNLKSIIEKKLNFEISADVNEVHWRAQDSTDKSILFYKASNTEKNIEIFKSRISTANYALCITNLSGVEDKKIKIIDNKRFHDLKERILNELYPFDSQAKCVLGVTGTNGKTTTVEIIKQVCILKGLNVLTVGTLGVCLNDEQVEDFELTSPSYIDLRKSLYKYSKNCHVIAMELSSHALDQNRLGSIRFDRIGWTNLSQDHLDYHKTMDNYFLAKAKIFEFTKETGSVIVSRKQKDLIKRLEGYEFEPTTMLGRIKNMFFYPDYNRENLEVAICLLKGFVEVTLDEIECLNAPPGRFNIYQHKSNFIIIDYAHTPDGLESICSEIKMTFPKHQLITIFGCGGDRDKKKRPLMGKAASRYSDFIYLTSDNPRFENPEQIIKDAEIGIKKPFEKIINREEAIKKAFLSLEDSVLLIAGKGHENYIDKEGTKHEYCDENVVKSLISND